MQHCACRVSASELDHGVRDGILSSEAISGVIIRDVNPEVPPPLTSAPPLTLTLLTVPVTVIVIVIVIRTLPESSS